MAQDWQSTYCAILRTPKPQGVYRADGEVLQQLLKALATGLEFTSNTPLGRPLGTFDAPRPKHAEAYRSTRSAADVALSLGALHDLAPRLTAGNTALAQSLNNGSGHRGKIDGPR